MIRRLLVVAALAGLASPAFAEKAAPPVWGGVDAATGQLSSAADLAALATDFPDSSSAALRLINAQIEAGDTDSAAAAALQLARRGYAFGPGGENQLSGYLDLDLAAWFHGATQASRAPTEKSTLVTTIPAEAQLVESIARDPATGDLYATTVVARALYVKHGAAEWRKIALDGAGSLSGIVWDPAAKLFWIASGDFDVTPGDKVYSALLGFDPVQGIVVRKLYANGMVALGDVAVGDDGTVYVSDPVEGIIHYAAPGDEGLHPLVGPGVFRSPQGMVAVPGKKLLIVSDYRYGLALLDTASGKVSRIVSAKPAMLDGIDGLARDGHSLIAVQNGTRPKRIVQLEMSGDWLTVEKLTVLESAHSAWTEPVGGSVSGGQFLYLGTGQWDRFAEGGTPAEGTAPGPTEVRALKLDD